MAKRIPTSRATRVRWSAHPHRPRPDAVLISQRILTPRQAEELRAAWIEARKTQPIRAVIENNHGVPPRHRG